MTLVPSPAVKHHNEVATAHYERSAHLATDYLAARGFTLDQVAPFRLGVVHDPLPGDEWLAGRLCIPYLTRGGIVELKFRCVEHVDCKAADCTKYLFRDGAQLRLFNVDAFFAPSPRVCVVEGELDALAVQSYTGLPAVGYPGASSWQPFFSRAFAGYEHVFVVADGDKPGRNAAKEVAKEIGRHAQQVQVVRLPDGFDSNSYLHEYGAETFLKALGLDPGDI